jgi:hypothetical protein
MDEIFGILFGWPAVGLFQGIAGALWPSGDARIRRLQRATAGLVLFGITSFLIGAAWVWLAPCVRSFLPFGVAHVSFVVAGGIGKHIEESCRKADKAEQGPNG